MDICILSNVEGLLFLLAPVPFWMLCLWSISLSLVNQRPVNLKKWTKWLHRRFTRKPEVGHHLKLIFSQTYNHPEKLSESHRQKVHAYTYFSQVTHHNSLITSLVQLWSHFTHVSLISGCTVGKVHKVHMVTSENLQDFVHTAAPDDLTGLLPWFCSRFTGRKLEKSSTMLSNETMLCSQ